MLRSLFLTLALALPTIAHAGDQHAECLDAELSYDGRYVRLRPACELEAVYDLHTRQLLRGDKAKEAIVDMLFLPLTGVPEDTDFGKWINKEWEADGQRYRWVTHFIRGSGSHPWILRYKVQIYAWEDKSPIIGKIQLAPSGSFEMFYLAKLSGDPTVPVAVPIVRPLVLDPPMDMSDVFTPATPSAKPTGKTKVVAFTYDAKLLKERMGSLRALLSQAPLAWIEVTSESGSSGWRIGQLPANSFWEKIGAERDMRVVEGAGEHAYLGLEKAFIELREGRPTTLKLFKPYTWTLVELTPKQ